MLGITRLCHDVWENNKWNKNTTNIILNNFLCFMKWCTLINYDFVYQAYIFPVIKSRFYVRVQAFLHQVCVCELWIYILIPQIIEHFIPVWYAWYCLNWILIIYSSLQMSMHRNAISMLIYKICLALHGNIQMCSNDWVLVNKYRIIVEMKSLWAGNHQ